VKFNLSHDFPVGLTALWSIYGNPNYLAAKYKALGSSDLRILQAITDEQRICVVLERTITPDLKGVPDWARRLVVRDYIMRHENHCLRQGDALSRVNLRIIPVGAPVSISAAGSLSDVAADRSRLALDFDVTCTLPLVGKKVAEIFARKVHDALAEDHDFTVSYMRQNSA
jgi:hypothetical protein